MAINIASDSRLSAIPVVFRKLGLGALTAVVIGSMIGSGVFSLPQKVATSALPANQMRTAEPA